MSTKPIFVATHPRACSTAFERVFMTQRDTLKCIHEPFGDAFYFGPERLGSRYEDDEKARVDSGYSQSTYKSIFEEIMDANLEGKRIFIKDITHYLVPPNGQPASIAPSLHLVKRGVGTLGEPTDSAEISAAASPVDSAFSVEDHKQLAGSNKSGAPFPFATVTEPGNPSVVPTKILNQFHFAFLIRHPKHSIPSYWRCTIPPLDKLTGFYDFMPEEAGYDEQRRLFDYLRSSGQIGPKVAARDDGTEASSSSNESKAAEICVIDADDLLDHPAEIMEQFCKSVGVKFTPDMLNWDSEEHHAYAKNAFEKWKGFHEDAIDSTELKPREHKKADRSVDDYYPEWVEKYGEEGAKVIKATVEKNTADYEYMKQFAIKV